MEEVRRGEQEEVEKAKWPGRSKSRSKRKRCGPLEDAPGLGPSRWQETHGEKLQAMERRRGTSIAGTSTDSIS